MLETPILFLAFNRPYSTKFVFDQIRLVKPKLLFIALDGPRINNDEDVTKCAEVKQIISNVDWDCEVKTLFRTTNLGCGRAVSLAITWFFEYVEEGIILEDDCLPNLSFFKFCNSNLNKYRNDNNVMMICGTSYQPRPLDDYTYYFSKYVHVWGWATWKRAWDKYNFLLEKEDEFAQSDTIKKTFYQKREQDMWINNIRMIINGFDTWDYQWMYWIWKHNGICIIPWKNLISNIGFGLQATHTIDINSRQSAMQQFVLMEILHPKVISVNQTADQIERTTILLEPQYIHLFNRAKSILRRLLKSFLRNE